MSALDRQDALGAAMALLRASRGWLALPLAVGELVGSHDSERSYQRYGGSLRPLHTDAAQELLAEALLGEATRAPALAALAPAMEAAGLAPYAPEEIPALLAAPSPALLALLALDAGPAAAAELLLAALDDGLELRDGVDRGGWTGGFLRRGDGYVSYYMQLPHPHRQEHLMDRAALAAAFTERLVKTPGWCDGALHRYLQQALDHFGATTLRRYLQSRGG